jgi:hypothetical protein
MSVNCFRSLGAQTNYLFVPSKFVFRCSILSQYLERFLPNWTEFRDFDKKKINLEKNISWTYITLCEQCHHHDEFILNMIKEILSVMVLSNFSSILILYMLGLCMHHSIASLKNLTFQPFMLCCYGVNRSYWFVDEVHFCINQLNPNVTIDLINQ